jgi:hypothetical protein
MNETEVEGKLTVLIAAVTKYLTALAPELTELRTDWLATKQAAGDKFSAAPLTQKRMALTSTCLLRLNPNARSYCFFRITCFRLRTNMPVVERATTSTGVEPPWSILTSPTEMVVYSSQPSVDAGDTGKVLSPTFT